MEWSINVVGEARLLSHFRFFICMYICLKARSHICDFTMKLNCNFLLMPHVRDSSVSS